MPGSVCGGGIFTHGPEAQTTAGAGEIPCHENGDHQHQIDHEVVGKQHLAQNGDIPQEARQQRLRENCACGLGDLKTTVSNLAEILTKELAVAHAEDGQGQTGDVLIGAQRDRQERIEQAAQSGGKKCAGKGQQNRYHGDGGVTGGTFIDKCGNEPSGAAHVDQALHAEVHIADFFREDLSQCAIHQGGAHQDGSHKKVDDKIHAAASFFSSEPLGPSWFFLRKIIR